MEILKRTHLEKKQKWKSKIKYFDLNLYSGFINMKYILWGNTCDMAGKLVNKLNKPRHWSNMQIRYKKVKMK